MAIKGVGGKPFINLDQYVDVSKFESLYDEMMSGISKSWVDKGVVSCGVRPSEEKLELCHVLQAPEKYLSPSQVKTLASLTTLHQKAWYCTLLLPIHHPYSLVFIRREREFWKKQYEDFCDWTENAQYFPKTIEFIKTLPFEQIGRILFFISESHQETLIHYDGGTPDARDRDNTEMIYFRPMGKKKLFIRDEEQKRDYPVEGLATFWNDLDWHGVPPSEGKTFSLRIDGIFTQEFRRTLGL